MRRRGYDSSVIAQAIAAEKQQATIAQKAKEHVETIVPTIRSAFAEVKRPALTMADAEVLDDWGNESSRFEEHDSSWWEIPDELIARHSNVFCFLPPKAELYYLPAYMSWFLRGGYKADSNSCEHLIYFMSDSSRFEPVWNLMNPEQRNVILRFAQACSDLAFDEVDLETFETLIQAVKGMPH